VSTLRTFSSVKGLSVFDVETGQELGVVEDLCFQPEGEIQGVVMDIKGFLKRDKIIPIPSIASFGPDGLMVSKGLEFKPKTKEHRSIQHSHKGIIGKPLLTAEGEKLGLIEDVYFKEEVGTIIGYEVTDGFFADMTEGRKVIKTKSPAVIGETSIVVDLKTND
jgi:uncharacterized protein YrrD